MITRHNHYLIWVPPLYKLIIKDNRKLKNRWSIPCNQQITIKWSSSNGANHASCQKFYIWTYFFFCCLILKFIANSMCQMDIANIKKRNMVNIKPFMFIIVNGLRITKFIRYHNFIIFHNFVSFQSLFYSSKICSVI